MKTSRHESAAHDEAALWAARLDGDVLDADQRAALDAWLSEDASRRTLLSSYCQFSADLEEKVQALRNTGASAVTVPEARATKRRNVWNFPGVAGVALAAAAAIAFALWIVLPKPQQQDFYAGIAQRQAHTLADGTRIELNAHTTLRFENGKTERRVRLAGGEALFEVAKDAARPFIVETPSGAVQVTGTTFNVRHDTGAIALQVTVVEGSVQVRPSVPAGAQASGPVPLTAGDQLSAGSAGVTVRSVPANALEDVLAWREGQIVFEEVPLHEVAARLARHHGRNVTVAPEIAGLNVSGRYSMDDFRVFTAALEVALPVKTTTDLSGAVSIVSLPGR